MKYVQAPSPANIYRAELFSETLINGPNQRAAVVKANYSPQLSSCNSFLVKQDDQCKSGDHEKGTSESFSDIRFPEK
jgi:hypothetical protein